MNVFIDTNVVLDVLLERKPFLAESRCLWHLAELGRIRGLVSALTFANIYYIVGRLRDRKAADSMLTMLRDTFTPVELDRQILNQAMDAGFADFEDAIQYFSALRADATSLVTRNPDHYPKPALPVMSPKLFLTTHTFE